MRNEEEAHIDIVIGDITPIPDVLEVLQKFAAIAPHTQINLHFDNLSVPGEKLLSGEASLIIHHVDKADTRLEHIDFCTIEMTPVAAPGYLDIPIREDLRYEDLKPYTQCVIRDPGQTGSTRSYYLLDGARRITVGDQMMKKEVLLQGLGWGHMARFMIADELREGTLVSLCGKHIRKQSIEISIARLASAAKRPVAERLWTLFRQRAAPPSEEMRPRGGAKVQPLIVAGA